MSAIQTVNGSTRIRADDQDHSTSQEAAISPLPPELPPGRFILVEGRGEMFVREAGCAASSPCVVLLHDWRLSADLNWFATYERLAVDHRLVAPDHRGHGRGIRSEQPFTLEAAADDIGALLGALDPGPTVVVGYGMGGCVGLLLAERHPETVAGLVLAATGGRFRASLRDRARFHSVAPLEYVLRAGGGRGMVSTPVRRAVEGSPELRPLLGWFMAELARGDRVDLASAAHALARFDGEHAARRLDMPSAVIVTTEDKLVRAGGQRALGRAMPGALVLELAGGHESWIERPKELARFFVEAVGWVGRPGRSC